MNLPSSLLRLPLCLAWLHGFALPVSARPGDFDPTLNPMSVNGKAGTLLFSLRSGDTALTNLVELPDRKLLAHMYLTSTRALVRLLPDGTPDPAFGAGGVVPITTGASGPVEDMVRQNDGKILLATYDNDFEMDDRARVLRFLPDGTPDLSFGTGGAVTLPGNRGEASTVLPLSNGKIIVGGRILSMFGNWYIARLWQLLPDGSPDLTFGEAGGLTFEEVGRTIRDIVVQPDGKIVFAGGGQPSYAEAWLGRCDPAGKMDPSFGVDGFVRGSSISLTGGEARSAVLQKDGRIVITSNAGEAVVVARFNADGSLDTGFNGSGSVITKLSYPASTRFIAVQPDGKLVVGAFVGQFFILRYLPNGTLDERFGTGGIVSPLAVSSTLSAMLLQADGRIVAGGYAMGAFLNLTYPALLVRLMDRDLPQTLAAESPSGTALPGGGTVKIGPAIRGQTGTPEASIILRNTGNIPLTNLSAALTGPEAAHFSLLSLFPPELPAGGAATVTVRFLPSSQVSSFAAALVIKSADPDMPRFVAILQGATVDPVATLTLRDGAVPLADSATLNFGPAVAARPLTRALTIQNTGNIELHIQGISLGTVGNPEDFTLSTPETDTLAPGASTAFTVTFTPQASGDRTARLRIASTDTLHPPREITLAGHGAETFEAWLLTHFGSLENTGDAADLSDPDQDGIPNLLEYATFTDPLSSGPSFAELAIKENTIEYTFMRPAGAAELLDYSLQRAESPDGPWSPLPWNETILTDDGVSQNVRLQIPNATVRRAFLRLMVSKP